MKKYKEKQLKKQTKAIEIMDENPDTNMVEKAVQRMIDKEIK